MNNYYYQNNVYNPGFMGGAMYAPQQQKPLMVNPLTEDERAVLKTDNSFSLQVTPAEMAQAICTHKDPVKGEFSVVPNADGTCTCKICHETFNPDQVDENYVNDAVVRMTNVLETCKYLAVDLNPEVTRNYFQMLPFIKKAPQLYKLAHNSFSRYTNANPTANLATGPNYFNGFMALMNPAISFAQPQYGYPQQAQYGYPTATQQMAAQAVPGGNPFYQQPMMPMGQPVAPVAPAATTAMNPPAYQAPAAPAAETVTVKESVQL